MQIPHEIHTRLTFIRRKTDDEANAYPSEVVLQHEPRPCEACDRVCVNRCTVRKLLQHPKPHWKELCLTCRRVRHPDTGLYSLTDKASTAVFRSRLTQNK